MFKNPGKTLSITLMILTIFGLIATAPSAQAASFGVFFNMEGTQSSMEWGGEPGEIFEAYVIVFINYRIIASGFQVILDPEIDFIDYSRPAGTGHFCCGGLTLDSGGAPFIYHEPLDGTNNKPIWLATLYLTMNTLNYSSSKIEIDGYCGCMAAYPYNGLFVVTDFNRVFGGNSTPAYVIQATVDNNCKPWGSIKALYRQ